MKRKFAYAAGAVVAAAAFAGAANAQDFYIKGFGGWTMPFEDDFQLNDRTGGGSTSSGLDYDAGYALGAAVGYDFSPSLALEGEYVRRDADASFKNTDGGTGSTKSNAFMVNAIYKFRPVGATQDFQPYAGAGIGVADMTVDVDGEKLESDYGPAYQLIGGVGYDVAPQLGLFGEARYFATNSRTSENDDLGFKSGYGTLDVLFGATYRF